MDSKQFAELQLRNLSSVVDKLTVEDIPRSQSAVERIRAAIAECKAEHRGELLAQLECIVLKLSHTEHKK